jgi:hypothetical protein
MGSCFLEGVAMMKRGGTRRPEVWKPLSELVLRRPYRRCRSLDYAGRGACGVCPGPQG